MKRQRGFTIVELITVVIIISILASIALVGSNYVQKQARDNERKSDVLLLKNAIEKYYDDNGSYPAVCPVAGNSCSAVLYLTTPLVPKYISSIPNPPSSYGAGYYPYVSYPATNSTQYAFLVQNESDDDCKTGTNMVASWWSSAPNCSY
ncbi:MAG: prepilin-type N-terminal cleavage/methylation domain-containing protein [Candidatus Saccharimonas sp.]